jgi:NADPH:quinone reductase-like Zn-dependent oxidoreductase
LHRLTHTIGFDEPGLHDPEIQELYYFVDTGIIAVNVYVFAAAHGLASWFHNCEKQALAKRLALRPGAESAVRAVGRLARERGGDAMKLSGNTVLITGGSSGIGYAMAEAFLGAGSTVIIPARDPRARRTAADQRATRAPGFARARL